MRTKKIKHACTYNIYIITNRSALLLWSWNPSDQNHQTKHAIGNEESNQNVNVGPPLSLMEPSLLQHIASGHHACTSPCTILTPIIGVPYQTPRHKATILIDQKRVKSILVHTKEMHEQPIFGHVIFWNEVAWKKKETAQTDRDKRSPGNVVWSKGTQEEHERVCH